MVSVKNRIFSVIYIDYGSLSYDLNRKLDCDSSSYQQVAIMRNDIGDYMRGALFSLYNNAHLIK